VHCEQLPRSIVDNSSPAYNKGKVGVDGASPAVAEAYAEASRQSLRTFFECRAEEMASGGVLCFYCPGRRDRAHPENQLFKDSIHFLPYFEKAWKEVINEVFLSHFYLAFLKLHLDFLAAKFPDRALLIYSL
jgi:hypothetical protein